MSKRNSTSHAGHVGHTGHGSHTPNTTAKKNLDQKGKKLSVKDGSHNWLGLSRHGNVTDIKEGETFYRTVKTFPSLPTMHDEVLTTLARLPTEKVEVRRGSFFRDDTTLAPEDRAASAAASADKRVRLTIWPEWNDADVNAEKWDVAHKGKGKEDKGKSPVVQHFFEDAEGKIEMPHTLKVDHWRRPQDFITEGTPVVVDPDGMSSFDLVTNNEHIHNSELMRCIISQIQALWDMNAVKTQPAEDLSMPYEEYTYNWRPWEHIYSLCKVGKAPHVPLFNPHGKYVVKLYWMGCWRKIIVDDFMPFDDESGLLLPATTLQNEIWPMILTKALVKVASLDYSGGSGSSEFGDCSIIHCLTGWLPEAIPLHNYLDIPVSVSTPKTSAQLLEEYRKHVCLPFSSTAKAHDGFFYKEDHSVGPMVNVDRHGHMQEVWELLKDSIPEWKLGEQDWEKPQDPTPDQTRKEGSVMSDIPKEEKGDKDSVTNEKKVDKPDSKKEGKEKGTKDAKEKEKSKDGDKKDKKDKDKDKDKNKEKSIIEEIAIPEKPEIVVFASYGSTPKYPVKVSVLGEMADASERLRQNGISHLYPHPVLITQTRSCPLEPPLPPENIPAWKLIRPRKKKTTPSDEPKAEPEPAKPIQCLEVTSPFVNYKVSPVPIPTDIHRPKSALERGSTRSRPSTSAGIAIEETDENAPEPEKGEGIPTPKSSEESIKADVQASDSSSSKPSTPNKPGTPQGKRKPGSAIKREPSDASPRNERKVSKGPSNQPLVKERTRSASSMKREKTGKSDEKDPQKDVKAVPQGLVTGTVSGTSQDGPADGGLAGDAAFDSGETTLLDVEPVEEMEPDTPKPKKFWMDYDTFFKCFKTLFVFHKPVTYLCNHKHSDLKSAAPATTTTTSVKDKKGAPAAAVVNASSSKTSQTPTSHSHGAPSPSALLSMMSDEVGSGDDRSPHFLFVDNLKPTEIVVMYSALSRWHEPPPMPILAEEKKSHSSLKGVKDKDLEKEVTAGTSSSLLEGSISREQAPPPPVMPGTLVAEPYSWKSLVTGQPVMRLRTSATRAAVLSLPAGRHVLRFMMTAPLGFHVHLSSTVNFVFGEEETVMSHLKNESCRFVDNAVQVIQCLGKCVTSYGETEAFRAAFDELVTAHCPYRKERLMSKQYHFKIFNDSLYHMLKKALADAISPEMVFAWRAFNFDVTTKCILGNLSGSRPATGNTSHRGSAKTSSKKRDAEKVENPWAAKYVEPTPDEHVAAVKIQTIWRGYYVRKLNEARQPGSEEHNKVFEQLQKAWSLIEPNTETYGLYLFRHLFKTDPELMPKYPFYKDEWNKICYEDYQGSYPDQPPNTWFVIFREIFYVHEEMLAVPKIYVPINTCMLRVVNNDTGEEIPRVFQKVAPYVYKRNKRGYTFVAEARTTDLAIIANRWRMRLIGSLSPLPSPSRPEVNSSFNMKEIRDYYLPNNKNIIFRYSVKVSEDHLASLQVNTSKPDVYVKLIVLDNEEEVLSVIGKGHAVLPAIIFLKDISLEQDKPPPEEDKKQEDSKRTSSRASNKGKVTGSSSQQSVKGKRSSSAKSQDGRGSRSSPMSSEFVSGFEYDEKDLKPHKYIVQALVLRNSWPLSESSWTFVQMLKDMEKNELKVAYKERVPSPMRNEKASAAASKGSKPAKGSKDKGGKEKDQKGSRPPSQQFDQNKPYWTLRLVSDASNVDDVEVKKDTDRADEIRAMKKAWEDAEPGRAAKALQSRMKYLNSHMVKSQPDGGDGGEEGEEPKVDEEKPADMMEVQENLQPLPPFTPLSSIDQPETEGVLTLEPPRAPTPKEMLQPLDVTPFLRKAQGEPRYLDELEIQRQVEERQREIQEYRTFRERVEKWREQDRQNRNLAKQKQLDDCEELQATLDAAREAVNMPREAIRQRHLEEERRKQEELLAQEAAMKAEQDQKSPKGKKGSAKGKKSPAGKKKK